MYVLENLISELFNLLASDSPDLKKITELSTSPLLIEHELAHAAYALLSKRNHLGQPKLHLHPLKSGAIPLFERGFFPWGALPYPKEHALLGSLLVNLEELGDQVLVSNMASFQQATLDHHKKPIRSLFLQEGGALSHELEEANDVFFQALNMTPSDTHSFIDHEIGIIAKRTEHHTVLCVGSGCKSGMGAFLAHDVGIVNFGPQLLPLGDCGGFGLAGRGKNINIEEQKLSYLCRLAVSSDRNTGFSKLQDSGYSALWLEAEMEANEKSLSLKVSLEGLRPLNTLVFTLFGKGKTCVVSSSHKLHPRSLDRYEGPVQSIEFCSEKGSVCVEGCSGFSSMEVIPLAGDESYWGADFLLALKFATPQIELVFTTTG